MIAVEANSGILPLILNGPESHLSMVPNLISGQIECCFSLDGLFGATFDRWIGGVFWPSIKSDG